MFRVSYNRLAKSLGRAQLCYSFDFGVQQMVLLMVTAKLTVIFCLLWSTGGTVPRVFTGHFRCRMILPTKSAVVRCKAPPCRGFLSLCNPLRNSRSNRPAGNLVGSLEPKPMCPLPGSTLGPGLVNMFPCGMLHLADLPGQTTATCTFVFMVAGSLTSDWACRHR